MRDLVKAYDGRAVVDGLTFEVQPGEVFALLGPNGAGKTTTVEILEGYRRPDRGSVRVLGLDPAREGSLLKPRIGLMLQQGGLFPQITTREALRLFAAFYPNPEDPDALLEQLELGDVARTRFRQLSGGQKQRLSLGLALIGRPHLVFLDEPTAAMDPQARHNTWRIIRSLRERGTTVLLTTHFMDEAEQLANRVAIVDRGRLVALDSPAGLRRSVAHEIRCVTQPAVSIPDLADALGLARSAVERENDATLVLRVEPTPERIAALTTWLAAQGALLTELRAGSRSLEQAFLTLTSQRRPRQRRGVAVHNRGATRALNCRLVRLLNIKAMRACLAAVLAATLLLAPAAQAQSATADVSGLRQIESQVSQIRGLQPMYEPDLRLLDAAGIDQFLVDEFDSDYLPVERELDQKAWVALGLIKSTDDLVQIQLGLLSEQVVGIYDADSRSMFVLSNNQQPSGAAEKVTYAHEFNHALQDQHFDLNKLVPKHTESADRSIAVHSLVEGDAVMLQTLWAAANLGPEELVELARGAAGADTGLFRVPLVVRTEMLFPYVEGFNFVRQAYRQAGNSYTAVDALFENPPESTAQILHPEKYRAQVRPTQVELGDVTGALGWRKIGTNVLGELDTRVLLEQWGTDHSAAVRIASSWAGDRYQVLENNGRPALAIKWSWESPEAARAFFSAYTRGLRTRFDSATVEETSATRQALTTPVTATDVRLDGTDVSAVIAFDRDTANALVATAFPSPATATTSSAL